VSAANTASYLKNGGVEKALAEIVVEYSALLAQNHDEVATATPGVIGHEHGIIYQDAAKNLLIADLSSDLWSWADTGTTVDIIGKAALIDAVAASLALSAFSLCLAVVIAALSMKASMAMPL